MTEPIKLPPDLLAVTLVREGVNKHRARDIECWMNEKMALAVEQATAELRAEVERLRADHATLLDNASIEVRRLRAESNKMEAEVERLRADAERYRWLRDMDEDPVMSLAAQYTDCLGSAISISTRIDAAIDAALKEPK
jgi:cell division septum initiation protein DivIVA